MGHPKRKNKKLKSDMAESAAKEIQDWILGGEDRVDFVRYEPNIGSLASIIRKHFGVMPFVATKVPFSVEQNAFGKKDFMVRAVLRPVTGIKSLTEAEKLVEKLNKNFKETIANESRT